MKKPGKDLWLKFNKDNDINFLKNFPGYLYWLDENHVFLGCNKAYAEILGLASPEEILGKTPDMLFADNISNQIIRNSDKVITSMKEDVFEELFINKDSIEMIFLSHKKPFVLEQQQKITKGVLSISVEISQYKFSGDDKVEIFKKMNKEITGKDLKHKQQTVLSYVKNIRDYLENIIYLMPGSVYWKDKNGVILGCNQNMVKYFGFKSSKDIKGLADFDILDKEQAENVVAIDKEIMDSGIPKTLEEESIRPNGEKFVFLSRKEPLYDKTHNVIGLLGISIDITDKKRAEEAEAKIEGMKLLAAAMAHELRNPLSAINVNMDIINDLTPNLIETKKPIANIKKLLQTSFDFINMVLNNLGFTAINKNDFSPCSVLECVHETIADYPFQKESNRALIKIDASHDFYFNGSKKIFKYALANLIKNAIYYIQAANKGDITIQLKCGDLSNQLIFRDTGAGIKPDLLPHIFERFFTQTENGTGVGLAFCRYIMESFGGTITCESEYGQFTQFILTFPTIQNHTKGKGNSTIRTSS